MSRSNEARLQIRLKAAKEPRNFRSGNGLRVREYRLGRGCKPGAPLMTPQPNKQCAGPDPSQSRLGRLRYWDRMRCMAAFATFTSDVRRLRSPSWCARTESAGCPRLVWLIVKLQYDRVSRRELHLDVRRIPRCWSTRPLKLASRGREYLRALPIHGPPKIVALRQTYARLRACSKMHGNAACLRRDLGVVSA
jgi:hypothetical protein